MFRRRRRHHPPPRARGRHDTRVVVVLVAAVTAFTFWASDDTGDVTVEDLRDGGPLPDGTDGP